MPTQILSGAFAGCESLRTEQPANTPVHLLVRSVPVAATNLSGRFLERMSMHFKMSYKYKFATYSFRIGSDWQSPNILQFESPIKRKLTILGSTISIDENEPVEYIAPIVTESKRFSFLSKR